MLADRMLGGFGVRFTVQFNLFAGLSLMFWAIGLCVLGWRRLELGA